MQRVLVGVLVLHGMLHLMGFAKAFGRAELPQLTQPISRPFGLLWLAAALALFTAATFLAFAPRLFFVAGGAALVLSQIAVVSSWTDAKYGTLPNVVLLLAVALGTATHGPGSLWSEYHEAVRGELAPPVETSVVRERDLERLPEPVQKYLRVTGSLGKPRVHRFEATWRGRIRGSASEGWMPLVAEQHNTSSGTATRLFFMSATMKHLPVSIFHRFVGEDATFRVRLLSAFTLIDAKGPEMNRSETVTIFNDACLLAPSTLLDPSVTWEPGLDPRRVRAHYTRGSETVAAELLFDEQGYLVDFVSDDRSAASPDGRSFERMRWSTPVREYRDFGGRRVPTHGEARWEALDDARRKAKEGAFTYLPLDLESVAFDRTSR